MTDQPQPDLEQIRAEIQQLIAHNNATIQSLAAQGVAVEPGSLIGLQVGVLLDFALGIDTPARLAHEHEFQRRLAAQLAEAATQTARARLLQGVQLGNGRPA